MLDANKATMDAAPEVTYDETLTPAQFDKHSQEVDAYWKTHLTNSRLLPCRGRIGTLTISAASSPGNRRGGVAAPEWGHGGSLTPCPVLPSARARHSWPALHRVAVALTGHEASARLKNIWQGRRYLS